MTSSLLIRRFMLAAAAIGIANYHATLYASPSVSLRAGGAEARDGFALHRRLTGRMDSKPFYVAVRGDVFGWIPGVKSAPLFSIIGFWTLKLVPLNDGSDGYVEKRAYCGFYTKFGTRDVMTNWVNPFTGASLDVINTQLRSPSLYYTYQRNGIYAPASIGGRRLAPPSNTPAQPYAFDIVGKVLYMPEQIWLTDPATTLSYEETTWSADAKEMKDGSDRFVAAERSYSSLNPGPRMKWAHLPEGSIMHIKASGQKLERLDDMPPDLLSLTRSHCPDVANANFPD